MKSRYQTDCDRAFPVKSRSFDAFDYVIVVFLNNGFYYRRRPILEGFQDPEYYTLPTDFIRQNHYIATSGWEKVLTKGKDLDRFKNERGFEIIAQDLGIAYPGMEGEI